MAEIAWIGSQGPPHAISPINIAHDEQRLLRDVSAPSLDTVVASSCGEKPSPDSQLQVASLEALYISRGLFAPATHDDDDDDKRAFRRTAPKDAMLRYQFGRRPSIQLDSPQPPIPPRSPSRLCRSSAAGAPGKRSTNFSKPLPPTSDNKPARTSPGPRPPPWGSSDNLELHRQTRHNSRDREEARRLRHSASSSMYKALVLSTDTLPHEVMKREVDEYREQVLRVYPDMEFDGSAKEGGRTCFRWLCVVM
ncbi:hypothetical protein ACEQ8H_005224 [Pleosporales sp. CAS-2024a]